MSSPPRYVPSTEVHQWSSHEMELFCTVGPETNAVTHTDRMRVAVQWCAAGNSLTPTALQHLVRWIGLGYGHLPSEVDQQVRLVARLRAPEFAWEFALRTLMASRRTEVLGAAAVAGSMFAAQQWMVASKLGPDTAGHVLAELSAPARQVFVNMGPTFPGTATQLASLVNDLMFAPA